MLTPIYTTTKTAITLRSGHVVPVGTKYVTGATIDQRGPEAVRWANEAVARLTADRAKLKSAEARAVIAGKIKRIKADGIVTVKGRELLLLLSKVHPSIQLTPAERGVLIASFDSISQEVVSK